MPTFGCEHPGSSEPGVYCCRMGRGMILGMGLVFLMAGLITRARAQSSPVIINEALANEPGAAVGLEWVEIYNRSSNQIDLAEFVFIDAGDTVTLAGMVLAPGEYGVLARRLTAAPGEALASSAESGQIRHALVVGLANDFYWYCVGPDEFDSGSPYEPGNTVFGRIEAGLIIGEELMLLRRLVAGREATMIESGR